MWRAATPFAPPSDSHPEVIISRDAVLIGEEVDPERPSAAWWNVLVGAIKGGRLHAIPPHTQRVSGHEPLTRR